MGGKRWVMSTTGKRSGHEWGGESGVIGGREKWGHEWEGKGGVMSGREKVGS